MTYTQYNYANKFITSYHDVQYQDEKINKKELQQFEQKLKTLKKDTLQKIYEILDYRKKGGFVLHNTDNPILEENHIHLKCKEYNHLKKYLNEINYALEKIKSEKYGYCEMTNERIEIERLKLVPTTRFSIEVQEMIDNRQRK